jgi:hypothetical protein
MKEREFAEMYGLHEKENDDGESFMQISCLATLRVDPKDANLYGTYQMESGTTFSMADGTEYTLARTPWFAKLDNGKTEPPKKEFQV